MPEVERQLTGQKMLPVKVPKKLLSCAREEDAVKSDFRHNSLGNLPHPRICPAVSEDEDSADHTREVILEEINRVGHHLQIEVR